jgi:ubiquinone/menaquinone biosynthesis C-methylase UbiE
MSETVWRPADPWNEATITAAEEATVRNQARLLELRGQGHDQATIRETYLDLLGIAPGEDVLDLGCGTGVVARAVARRVGAHGRVVGLDPSPLMLSVGREIAEREGLLNRIEFRAGDARELPFAEATFDVVLAVTALSHTTDAERVVPALVRVVRPGGRIGILDLDTPSWIIAHPDQDLTRRIGIAGSMVATDGWLARRLPGLLEAAGLEDVRVRAFTPIEQDPTGFYARQAEIWADAAATSGAISREEREGWVATLHAEQAANRFLAGITHLFIWGRRSER